jgi:acyl transferase domain-containing protein/SAM-dependent methyltransferase
MQDNGQNTELSPIKQALLAIKEMQAKIADLEKSKVEPIAVVSVACKFPGGCDTPEAFWEFLKKGGNGIVDIPAERWDKDAFYDADPDKPGKMYTQRGGFLQNIDQFDPAFFGISPREAASMDPHQRSLLQVTWESLENGGFDINALYGSKTGVYVGISNFEYGANLIWPENPENITSYAGTGGSLGVTAGRLSYTFGFTGPSMIIDTACSSSLVTTHLAMQALRLGECDMAISAGVNLIFGPQTHINFSKAKMLAPDGHCKTFSADADGYARGEGIGVVVLKRLSDAERDGDHILALLRGSAVNQDGPSGGLTVPNGPSQVKVIKAALQNAQIQASEVGYIEAHGTGTPLGDPIEVGALATVFGADGTRKNGSLKLASVKTNVGHLESAAGIAGLIKSVLSVQHGEIPPHKNFSKPNANIDWKAFPVEIPGKLAKWDTKERIAGISSFSFSGTNAHLVISNYDGVSQEVSSEGTLKPQLLVLSAKNQVNLNALAQKVREDLLLKSPSDWKDYCLSALNGRGHYNYRMAVVADAPAGASEMLGSDKTISGKKSGIPRKIAFLFTGQGAQYVNMGRQLFETEPVFRESIQKCDEIVTPLIGESMLGLLYDETPSSQLKIDQTEFTQPLLFAIEYSLAQLWNKWGIEPEAVIGHSLGELVAATVSGMMTLDEALKLVCSRGQFMAEMCEQGSMAAVKLSERDVLVILKEKKGSDLTIASVNGPDSTVVAGDDDTINRFIDEIASTSTEVKKLRVSHAFHSKLVEPMIEAFRAEVSKINFTSLNIPLISNVTGDYFEANGTNYADYWCDHIRKPVRFFDGLSKLIEDGFNTFIEIGPKPTLSAIGHDVAEASGSTESCVWLPSMRMNQDPRTQMLQSLGQIYVLGGEINSRFCGDEVVNRYPVRLPNTPFVTERYWYPHADEAKIKPPKFDGHPLLGQRFSSPALADQSILFANEISVRDTSFLAHHQVFGNIVLPAAGHIEMALAALAELYPNGAEISSVDIQKALVLSDVSNTAVQTVIKPSKSGSRFEIHSQTDESEPWQLHTIGEIIAGSSEVPSAMDLEKIKKRCDVSLDVDLYYSSSKALGIEHGEHFQALKMLKKGKGEMIGRLELPSGINGNHSDFTLHPVLLDAAFQMASYPLITKNASYLPTGLDHLRVYKQLPHSIWCRTSFKEIEDSEDLLLYESNMDLMDDSGNILAQISGLRFQRVDHFALQSAKNDISDWFYEIEWQKKPVFGQSASQLSQPESTKANLHDSTVKAAEKCSLYADLFADMDTLAAHFIQHEFLLSGWNPKSGDTKTTAELIHLMKVDDLFEHLFTRCLQMLEEDQVLRKNGDVWEVIKPFNRLTVDGVRDLRERFDDATPEMELFFRCAESLGAVWRNETDPLSLLFPDGDLSVTTLLYQHSVGARAINTLLAESVADLISKIPETKGIRILEIGGGTGGTTAHLLPHLPADRCDYLFTDISSHFTQLAEQQFGTDYPFVRYGTVDIEKPVSTEHLGKYDLIVAANVVHATRNIGDTLDNCRSMLAPGGILVLLEASAKQRWLDLTFGMTDGWWKFMGNDPVRSNYPLLTPQNWFELLKDKGFDGATIIDPDQIKGIDSLKQHVILAVNPIESVSVEDKGKWLVVSEDAGVFAELSELVARQS